jgi:hypothetical protein
VIEPTDEMGEVWEKTRRAYWAALKHDSGEGGLTLAEHERQARKQALAAVFELVERDLGLAGPCSSSLTHLFDTEIVTACELRHGHSGDHESGPTRWRELS